MIHSEHFILFYSFEVTVGLFLTAWKVNEAKQLLVNYISNNVNF